MDLSVLKRGLEAALMNMVVEQAQRQGIGEIREYYWYGKKVTHIRREGFGHI